MRVPELDLQKCRGQLQSASSKFYYIGYKNEMFLGRNSVDGYLFCQKSICIGLYLLSVIFFLI